MSLTTLVAGAGDPAGHREHRGDDQDPAGPLDRCGQRDPPNGAGAATARGCNRRGPARGARQRASGIPEAPAACSAVTRFDQRAEASRRRASGRPSRARPGPRSARSAGRRRSRRRARPRTRGPSGSGRGPATGSPTAGGERGGADHRPAADCRDHGRRRGSLPARRRLPEPGLKLDRVVDAEPDHHREDGHRGHRQRAAEQREQPEGEARGRPSAISSGSRRSGGPKTSTRTSAMTSMRGGEQDHDLAAELVGEALDDDRDAGDVVAAVMERERVVGDRRPDQRRSPRAGVLGDRRIASRIEISAPWSEGKR